MPDVNRERRWLRDIRIKRKKTQKYVADESLISRSFYTKIELGVKDPSLETQYRISKVLKFNPRLFVDHIGSLEEHSQEIV